MSRRRPLALLAAAAAFVAAAALPTAATAAVDPVGCTPDIQYDTSVPTWDQWFADGHNVDAKTPLGAGPTGTSGRNLSAVLYDYFDGVMAATQDNPRVRVVKKDLGKSTLGRDLNFYVIGTKENIANLDAGRNDGAFWSGVRAGTIPEAEGVAAVSSRPAFAWVTATPHGAEPAAGEAIARQLYELAARLDCGNARRLQNLDVFLMPVRNPDGRDATTRYTAWGFDPNRDFGTRQLQENRLFIPEMNKYPGVFYIDAHEQSNGYFFPPNEDPVHHELSDFTLDFIQNKIGPALQQVFNDQTSLYQNYNRYDMFTPEYGDTVPSLIMGAAGMTYEKGTSDAYGKQVYDHYLAIDTTINLTANDKNQILRDWVEQWQQATDQGERCDLQDNKLVSPLHDEITQQPTINGTLDGPRLKVCGYFYRPGAHAGDVQSLIRGLQEVGVHVYRLDSDVNVAGLHEFGTRNADGTPTAANAKLPKGTLYIPMSQPQKHWIQAVLGEDPFIPFPYFYDVVTWSYSLQRGMAGNGFLMQQMPPGVAMTEIGAPSFGTVTGAGKPMYAFDTDSMQALGLTIDLLSKGVKVSRAKIPFDAGGRKFLSGTALVDASTLGDVDLAALAASRGTPVYGLDSAPVARFTVGKPKIGLYTGSTTIPANPVDQSGPNVGSSAIPGYCSSTTFCPAYSALLVKDKIPGSQISAVTSTDLANGRLTAEGFTVLINPNMTAVPAGAAGTALQEFVNAGGRYIGFNNNGTTSGRNAGITNLNTQALSPGLTTPGSTFAAEFVTTNPVAWGFDAGGWIYRDATGNPIYDPATLAGSGSIPGAEAVVSYGEKPLRTYGYQVNALGPGRLDGRPAVVDQPFGQGHAVFFGFDPLYRSWKEQDERMVLNAVLYPTGEEIPADATISAAATKAALKPAAKPIAAAKLPTVKRRPLKAVVRSDRDVQIQFKRRALKRFKAAVRRAQLPAKVRARVRYVPSGTKIVFTVKGVRTANEHARADWVARVMGRVTAAHIKVLRAQL